MAKLRDDQPIFQQIAELIETNIIEGSLDVDERVPSTNEIAKYYPINPQTAAKGIQLLAEEGILYKRRGIGMFVFENAREIILTKKRKVLKVSSYYYPNWDQEKAEKLVKLFRLKLNQKVKGLSKGMYSALGIIVGLSSNAPVTIFDKPYIGLDVSFRSIFYELLLEEYEQNPRMII